MHKKLSIFFFLFDIYQVKQFKNKSYRLLFLQNQIPKIKDKNQIWEKQCVNMILLFR